MSHPHHSSASARRQQGSILIPAAAALLVCVILLGAAQLGLYFSVKREAQNAVDLAALNNVVLLDKYEDDCAAVRGYVKRYLIDHTNFDENLDDPEVLKVNCKYVERRVEAMVGESGDEEKVVKYVEGVGGGPANAIDVSLNVNAESYAYFAGLGLENIYATATAYLPPIDELLEQQRFSVHYDTLGVNGEGLVAQLLETIGLEAQYIDVLTHNGLVNAKVTPAGLLEALGIPVGLDLNVATPSELLELERVSLASLLEASATVLGQQDLVDINEIDILNALVSLSTKLPGIDSLEVPLFGPDGFLSISNYETAKAALMTRLDWGDFLNTAIFLSDAETFLTVPLNLDIGIVKVQSAVRVIEPPSSAPLVEGASASHANARVYLQLKLNLIGVLKVDLPIVVEVGQGEAVLENLQYSRVEREDNWARFEVGGSVANLCIGRFSKPDEIFSRENACSREGHVDPHTILEVLGLGVTTKLQTSLLSNNGASSSVKVDLIGQGPFESAPVNTFKLNLSEIVSTTLGHVLSSSIGLKGELPRTQAGLLPLTSKLVGGGEGSVYSDLDEFNDSIKDVERRMPNSLLGLVGSLLGFLLFDVVGGLLDGVFGLLLGLSDEQKLAREMQDGLLISKADERLSIVLLTVLDLLLEPLDEALNPLLSVLFKTLGLDVGHVTVRVDEFFNYDHFEGVLIHSTPASSP